MKRLLAIVFCVFIAVPTFATTKGKKLVLYACDCKDTAYYRAHLKEMEKTMPFDGLVISVLKLKDPDPPDMLGWNTLIPQRFQQKDYQHAIDDLKAVKSKVFTDNFIQVVAQMGMDWFDRRWPNMAYNASCMAQVAKEGGCKGLMLDAEQYDALHMWTYATLPKELKSKHTFAEYEAKARERGQEFIRAVNKEFPDLTILMLFGPSLTHKAKGDGRLEDSAYSLLAAFCDGMAEAATPGTTIIDGYEFSYTFKTRKEFIKGRTEIMDSINHSLAPDALKQHLRVGFGIWPEANDGNPPWNPNDLSKNVLPPDQLRTSINYALDATDKYAWVYGGAEGWYDEGCPKQNIEAIRLGRKSPSPTAPDK